MPWRSHFLISGPYGLRELEALQRLRDRRLLLARADVRAHEILRALRRLGLREMDDIDRRLSRRRRSALERLRQRRLRVGKLQRHRPIRRRDGHGLAPVQPRQFLLEKRRVAERRRHQQKPRLRQREQRHLPGHAALAIRVVVELVHDHVVAHSRRAPSRSAMFARISAVQQRIGASRFTDASPVLSPTFSGPNSRQSASHFSFTSALIGQV